MSFFVRGSQTCAEGWASRPLPFEPKGEMLEYRQALRRVLAALSPAGGRVFVGRYASADRHRCDVENLLLYNVGLSAFTHLRSQEVILVRSRTPVPPPEGDARSSGTTTSTNWWNRRRVRRARPSPA